MGKDHVVPDTLSRSVPVVDNVFIVNSPEMNVSTDRWYQQMQKHIAKSLTKYPAWKIFDSKLYKHIQPRRSALIVPNTDYWCEVVPRDRRASLIPDVHAQLYHLGIYKTFHKLANTYYWPKMRSDVAALSDIALYAILSNPNRKLPKG